MNENTNEEGPMGEEMVLFWGGPFSQWAASAFEIDGLKYNCAEQYMMACKAAYFDDEAAYDAIMATADPAEQKAIGRRVRGFVAAEWEKVCIGIVYKANHAKFTQCPWFRQELEATGDKLIVEASPYDTIWGIGLGENDPRALDRSQWRGTNWLGQVLMDVRADLRAGRNRYEEAR